MRKKLFRVLLALLAVSAAAGPGYSKVTLPFCLQDYQECAPCGWDLQQLCTHYSCDDGTERYSCGSCTYYCVVP